MISAVALLAISCSSPSPAALPIAPSQGSEASRVLVIVNSNSPDSISIGSYYIKKRNVPHANLLMVDVPVSESIPDGDFAAKIIEPTRKAIKASKTPIDYIVMTKFVPIVVKSGFSTDALLAGMDLAVSPIKKLDDATIRTCISPYFNKRESFSHAKFNLYLVTRLDGYTAADAKALVDNSITATASKGLFFFDQAGNRKQNSYGELDRELGQANDILITKGLTSKVDASDEYVCPDEPLAGYASWGSNDGKFKIDAYHKLKFKPGAVCETFVSTSGRTFLPTTGGQSLIADLIRQGVTGVKGYVTEPYTFALARPVILFDRYTSGYNLAESFYMASPIIKWKDVVIGDPLCRPYRKK